MENQIIMADDSGKDIRENIYLVVHIIGIALVILGVVFAVQVFWKVLAIINEPAILTGKVAQFTQLMFEHENEIPQSESLMKFARPLSILILILWYHLLLWIPICIIKAGAHVASAGASDRKILKSMQKAIIELKKRGM